MNQRQLRTLNKKPVFNTLGNNRKLLDTFHVCSICHVTALIQHDSSILKKHF